ncbi:MAG: DPP IV N-terminal domain-containing protein [Gemmatimonadaceae bacterium]
MTIRLAPRDAVAAASFVLIVGAAPAQAQSAPRPRVEYARADSIRTFDAMKIGGRVYPVWLADSTRFFYEVLGTGENHGRFAIVDPRNASRRIVDDSSGLIDRKSEGPRWAVRSPNKRWDAFVWNHNIYVRPAALNDAEFSSWRVPRPSLDRLGCDAPSPPGARVRRDSVALPRGSVALTHDGGELDGYEYFRFGLEVAQVAAERFELSPGELLWSPDSRRLVVKRFDLTGVGIYPMYSSTANQPIDHRYFYAAPGDTFVPRYSYVILDVAQRSAVPVRLGPIGAIGSIGDARWSNNGELFVSYGDRGAKHATISRVNSTTGIPFVVAGDSSNTHVELEDDAWAVADGGDDVFTISERDGWAHIYRYARDGKLRGQVERGDYHVHAIKRVDGAARQLYFTAYGVAGAMPYHARLYRVNFDGSAMTLLTPEAGNHSIRTVPHAPYFIDTYSETATPPVTVLRGNGGKVLLELARSDISALRATGWTPAEVFTVKARDGVTDLWGILHKPSNFDSTKRYPIVARVYPGPQAGSAGDWVFKGADNYVGTKVETTRGGRTVGRVTANEGMSRSLAELGFIVMQLDALGSSPLRSKAFHDFMYGRVGDNGLPDYVGGIKQLAARYPWIDTSRVGIVGHSGGGYTAAGAMLHEPDFFKVGVAMSGNHDFRVYGWYWGEKYQGLYQRSADGDNYEREANYKYAQQLKGKLMLMTGEMDCNNPAAETLRLVDALEKAGKEFDFIVNTDAGHQAPTHAIKRVWDFFVRNLLGAVPPDGYQMIAP